MDDDERLAGHGAVREAEATAVGAEAALEVEPVAHRVNGLAAGYLLEEAGRRVPRDALEGEEPVAEPHGQEVVEDAVHLPEQVDRVRVAGLDVPAHLVLRRTRTGKE